MSALTIPYCEIQAHYTEDTTTVHQAYSTGTDTAAVEHQCLDASPKFSITRMTWIKPSWAWMLYCSSYSYKDPGQDCILALSVRKEVFVELFRKVIITPSHRLITPKAKHEEELPHVSVQWDPERTN